MRVCRSVSARRAVAADAGATDGGDCPEGVRKAAAAQVCTLVRVVVAGAGLRLFNFEEPSAGEPGAGADRLTDKKI